MHLHLYDHLLYTEAIHHYDLLILQSFSDVREEMDGDRFLYKKKITVHISFDLSNAMPQETGQDQHLKT